MFSIAELTTLVLGDAAIGELDDVGVRGACRLLARARGMLDTLDAALVSRSCQLHDVGAGPGPTEILALDGRLSHRDARRTVERAATLAALPELAAALGEGAISSAHADAVGRTTVKLDAEAREAFLGHEARLVAAASKLPPETFARHCQQLADSLGDGGLAELERQRRQTRLRRWIDRETGMYLIRGELDPETGTRVFAALDAMVERMWHSGAGVAVVADLANDNEHLAAHALAELVHAGHHHATDTPVSTEVSVLVDHRTLVHGLHEHGICELADGTLIPAETARRHACTADVIPVVLGGDGIPLDVGRARRLATHAQRRALRSMYRTCAFDGCATPVARCQPHHLREWEAGGSTDLQNLIPLCHRHHHLVHEGRWRLSLDPHRTLTTTRPDGQIHAVTPLRTPEVGGGIGIGIGIEVEVEAEGGIEGGIEVEGALSAW